MPTTVTVNLVRVHGVTLSYNPTAAAWSVTALYSVGYIDKTGTITDYAGLTLNGAATVAIGATQGPSAIAPILFGQILSQEGLTAGIDQVVDGAGARLF